ncbi:hypothetical protein E2562_035577 [Oryza meyeriana var. granulata]|uniref:Ubiquitin-like protease family profile domain-containing protein n=1 Tax=Oryza meyeriana var. granulata TaxID=110450 RepID=A0A6G1ESU6_9ORYZ|nr:hypothetical protein E2562_035577 [Oryza meyeriana var. granulata]
MELVERINFGNEDEGHIFLPMCWNHHWFLVVINTDKREVQVITRFIMARDNKGKRKVQEGKKVGGSSRSIHHRLDTSDDPAPMIDTSASRPQRRSTRTSRICYNEARIGEPAPPEPSEPIPCESSDAMASDATASDATASDDTASDQISEE